MKNFTKPWREVLRAFLLTTLALGVLSCRGGDGRDSGLGVGGIDGPHIVIQNGYLSIDVTFDSIELMGGLRYSIPEYPRSYVEIGPSLESDGTLMSLHMAVADLGGANLATLDPQTLPGGRPLPGIRAGRLPAVAFSIEEFHNIHIYAGNSFLGFFLPMPDLNVQYAILSTRFYLDDGTRAGNISLVGQDHNGENGGFLLLLKLKSELFQTSSARPFLPNLIGENSREMNAVCNPSDDDGDCHHSNN